ncbi:MAG: hypothetical protein WA104_02395 [Thermodesulfovibrionales bacterium]
MKFLIDSCISSFAVRDLKDAGLVDIPAKKQGEFLLRLVETYKDVLEKKALITVDRYRVRVRVNE